MDENKKNSQSQTKTIVALILLIVVLVLGVKMIFKGLEVTLPSPERSPAQSTVADVSAQEPETDLAAPSYCPHCGEKLPDSFQWGQYCPYCGEKVEE